MLFPHVLPHVVDRLHLFYTYSERKCLASLTLREKHLGYNNWHLEGKAVLFTDFKLVEFDWR